MNTNKPVVKEQYEAPAICEIPPVTVMYGTVTDGSVLDDGGNDGADDLDDLD